MLMGSDTVSADLANEPLYVISTKYLPELVDYLQEDDPLWNFAWALEAVVLTVSICHHL